jgi:hypothetical protein
MKIHYVEQGSAEWYELRLGKPTASQFHRIITEKKGEPSASQRGYMCQLIAELLLNEPCDDQLKIEQIERGKLEQPHAAQQFEILAGRRLDPVGFIETDDGRYGCSPDYLIAPNTECVEIKCPLARNQMDYLLFGHGTDYRQQVQGQFLIGGFELVHFYAYHPDMPEAHIPTKPDKPYIALLRDVLDRFCDKLASEYERAKTFGTYRRTERLIKPLDRAYPDNVDEDEPLQTIVTAEAEDGRDVQTILDAG